MSYRIQHEINLSREIYPSEGTTLEMMGKSAFGPRFVHHPRRLMLQLISKFIAEFPRRVETGEQLMVPRPTTARRRSVMAAVCDATRQMKEKCEPLFSRLWKISAIRNKLKTYSEEAFVLLKELVQIESGSIAFFIFRGSPRIR